MSSGINFKLVDPVAQLIASGGGSGSGLPLTGGTMSGAIVQPIAPVAPFDLTNKQYVDGAFQAKKPTAIPNNIAFFGSGADAGQTIDSTYSIDTVITNPQSNTTIWSSSRMIASLQYGANVFKATASINIISAGNATAFSAGNAIVGPATWPNTGSTFTLDGAGIATISNSQPYTTYYRITFVACSMSESTGASGSVLCRFQDVSGPMLFGVEKLLSCLPNTSPFPAQTFCNEAYLTALISVAPTLSFQFSVQLTNIGSNTIVVDPTASLNPCLLIIERVA
jgi:hypothetical protein